MIIKTFGNTVGKPMTVKEYEFVIKSKTGANLYMEGYGFPTICSTLGGQEVKVASDKFPCLKEHWYVTSLLGISTRLICLLVPIFIGQLSTMR